MTTLRHVKRSLITDFRNAGLTSPDVEARLLLETITGFSASELIIRDQEIVSVDRVKKLQDCATRRIGGEPLDHILGFKDFYGRRFVINKDVLSPRPETEGLVEKAIVFLQGKDNPIVLDLGTGSGAIIISILAEIKQAQGVATDLSNVALSIARENAQTHRIDDRLTFTQSDWFGNVVSKYDLIISNPPYITDAAMNDLSREVLDYDPDLALRGGVDGLTAYRRIIEQAPAYLRSGGALMFEIGYDQGPNVSALMVGAGFADVSVQKDLSGHDRIVTGLLC